MAKINLYDLNMYLPGDLLSKLDRASMMTSVEIRSPFLDHKLAEFAYNLPEEFKADNNRSGKFKSKLGGKWNGKIILKEAIENYLPVGVIKRKKQGFGPPLNGWLKKKEMKELIYELFISSDAGIYSFLNKKYIKQIVENFYNKEIGAQKLWTLMCLELWFKNNKKYHE